MMTKYLQHYKQVLKTNYMLLVMVLILLPITFFIWIGFPVFVVGSMVANFTTSIIINHFCIALSVGLIFSLYFIPFNFKVARNVATMNRVHTLFPFIHLQIILIITSAILFEIVILLLLKVW